MTTVFHFYLTFNLHGVLFFVLYICFIYFVACSVSQFLFFVVVQSDPETSKPVPPPRPPSELSQFGGSSGYGSTRSHVGPQLTENDDQKKFGSLRSCKRSRSEWPQFRSLRSANRRKMLPIKESSPELKTTDTKENKDCSYIENKITITVPATSTPIPPTPAPRKITSPAAKPTVNPKHTYQNIPIPITPNNSSNTDSVNSTNEEVSFGDGYTQVNT